MKPTTLKQGLVESTFKDGDVQRTVSVNTKNDGRVTVSEVDNDTTYITVMSTLGHATVGIDATQLWTLALGIVQLFGGAALRADDQRNKVEALRVKLFDVLQANESRCLDDNIDRDVVLAELLKVLT